MAFAFTIEETYFQGNKKVLRGTYTNTASSTGGDVETGLAYCEFFRVFPKGASAATNQPVVNETFPVVGGAITIVTDADETGYWRAEGV